METFSTKSTKNGTKGNVKKIKRRWSNIAEGPCSKWNGSIFKNLDFN